MVKVVNVMTQHQVSSMVVTGKKVKVGKINESPRDFQKTSKPQDIYYFVHAQEEVKRIFTYKN